MYLQVRIFGGSIRKRFDENMGEKEKLISLKNAFSSFALIVSAFNTHVNLTSLSSLSSYQRNERNYVH